MSETCEMQDKLVSNSGIAKGMPGRAYTLPNACCALPLYLQKDQDSLIEQSYILVKLSVNIIDHVNYT